MRIIGPLTTYIIGSVVSLLVAFLVGTAGVIMWQWASGLSEGWNYIPFYVLSIPTAALVFWSGFDERIPIGFVGVPELFGRRLNRLFFLNRIPGLGWLLDNIVLSEGGHWLPERVLDYTPVDNRVQTSPDLPVTGMSADDAPVRMDGNMFYRFKITRPYHFLSASHEKSSLDQVGISSFRDEIATCIARDLVRASATSKIEEKVNNDMTVIASTDYGIDIIKVGVKRLDARKDLEEAWASETVEKAKREAEKINTAALLDRIRELIDLGFKPEKAADVMQTERGKIKAESTIFRVGDLPEVTDAIKEVIKILKGKI